MPSPGDTIDRYVLEASIGEGGMGTVWRARDSRLDRPVALKILRQEETDEARRTEIRERLLREARAAAALSHPNAAHVYDVGEADGALYVAMELVRGRTLRAVLDSGDALGATPLVGRAGWLVAVGRALGAAHAAGLVHRDVKPENVMIADDGAVKVLDFGIARRVSSPVDPSGPTSAAGLGTLTAAGVQLGTPMYMAPEQIRGAALDGRADQFAWGVVLYETLTGRVPWKTDGDALALVASILTDPVPKAPDPAVPEPVMAVIRRALEKAPADRFPSLDEAVSALERALVPRATPSSSWAPKAMGTASDLRKYTDQEIEQILERALSEPDDGRRISLKELREAAREVGVDDASLSRAVQEIEGNRKRTRKKDRDALDETDDEYRSRKLRNFFRHTASFAVFSAFFVTTLGWSASHWLVWWGLGVAMHGVSVVFPKPRRKRKPMLFPEATARIDEGVRVLRQTAQNRFRVAELPAGPSGDGARARDVEAELEVERRADEIERERRGKKRRDRDPG